MFCVEHLQEPFCSDTLDRRFKLQLNEIHLDEKLFYVTTEKEDYYQHNLEEVPVKKGISKRFITRCMFLAVCARPRYDPHSKTFWDGKIGIYPIMELVPAINNSKNRPKGTLETKNVTMDSAKYVEMLVDQVLPDIHAKFRGDRNSAIFLQDDGAGPHTREESGFHSYGSYG